MMYNELQLDQIARTIQRLEQRISERFPESGLSKVEGELLRFAEETGPIITKKRKPHRLLQLAIIFAIVILVGVPLALLATFRSSDLGIAGLAGWFQIIESIIQDAIFLGVAIYFLVTVETRLDRRV